MLPLQSSTASVQNGSHTLDEIQPHVLKHPKMLCPQSSTRCSTEVNHPTWRYLNLMLLRNSNTLRQSSDMLSPGAFTTGPTIRPLPSKHPKTFLQLSALLTPRWSTWLDKSSTSCRPASRDARKQSSVTIAQSGLHILADASPHVLEYPKILGPQSLI